MDSAERRCLNTVELSWAILLQGCSSEVQRSCSYLLPSFKASWRLLGKLSPCPPACPCRSRDQAACISLSTTCVSRQSPPSSAYSVSSLKTDSLLVGLGLLYTSVHKSELCPWRKGGASLCHYKAQYFGEHGAAMRDHAQHLGCPEDGQWGTEASNVLLCGLRPVLG